MEGLKPSPIRYCTIGRMAATSRQELYKLKDGSQVQRGTIQKAERSLVPSGTVQIEGWKPSPNRDYANGR